MKLIIDKNNVLTKVHLEDNETKVTIPNGVTGISGSAFMDSTFVKEIEIPSSVTFINNQAFQNC